MRSRKIAANYIFLPGFPLVKNGYVEIPDTKEVRVVEMGGQLREIEGLEFYGGCVVPDYICGCERFFQEGEKMLPVLEKLFCIQGNIFQRVAIIEGADLLGLIWQAGTRVRLL